MTGSYKVESKSGYPGPKELPVGTKIGAAGVYTESLIPGTELAPYSLREIKSPVL